jgi:cytochrome c oxidase subunit 2
MRIRPGQFVEFDLASKDVTYGFGVFRKDGTMVFQFSVLPGYDNRFVWNFSEPGFYDVRSTEYSGAEHSRMLVQNAILVAQGSEVGHDS